uniref:COMM domain-containing protein 1 n=1 Tax=Paramoeba aestuarina TaxID=180227 RepID=A0A7S4NYB1_9EUKA|mmetsp:Transcript_32908/g.51448  ORF Transcript_32908/g.51448 Transcript_32908/m.51448 type:complete len:179 (+) Transcript_32908:50-586(+)
MDVPKLFHAMLTGVLRRTYEDDQDMTVEFFMENIFAGQEVGAEEVAKMSTLCEKVLRKAGSMDWDPAKLEAAIENMGFSEVQKGVFVHFWKNNKAKIHNIVLEKSNWNQHLSSVEWRLDMKTTSRKESDVNEPTAIVQLNFQKKEEQSSVLFEMDKAQLEMVMNQINSIQHQIDEISK